MTITLEAHAGDDIRHCCDEAVRIAKILGTGVHFMFNETDVLVSPYDNPADIVVGYWKARDLNRSVAFARPL